VVKDLEIGQPNNSGQRSETSYAEKSVTA